MKVAIIGAGISGLACAHELIRNGITPTVFEKKSYIGEVLDLPVIIMDMFNIPVSKPFEYLKRKFELDIKPHYTLNEIIMHSPSKSLTVKSNYGYILKKGQYIDSLESQIMQSTNIPINFNSFIDIRDIKNDFEHIVVATGTPNIAKDLDLFTSTFDAYVRIATILGEFNVNSVPVWVNTAFAKNSYAYIVPNSEKDARLVLIVNNIYPIELDYYWNKFLTITNGNYNIRGHIDIRHHAGLVKPVQYDNIMFCGNAGGFLDDILGFGTVKALLSGVMAAKAIVKNRNYKRMCKKLTKDIYDLHKFRKVLDTLENKDFDMILSILGTPGIKQYIYENPSFKAVQGVIPARILNLIMGNS